MTDKHIFSNLVCIIFQHERRFSRPPRMRIYLHPIGAETAIKHAVTSKFTEEISLVNITFTAAFFRLTAKLLKAQSCCNLCELFVSC